MDTDIAAKPKRPPRTYKEIAQLFYQWRTTSIAMTVSADTKDQFRFAYTNTSAIPYYDHWSPLTIHTMFAKVNEDKIRGATMLLYFLDESEVRHGTKNALDVIDKIIADYGGAE